MCYATRSTHTLRKRAVLTVPQFLQRRVVAGLVQPIGHGTGHGEFNGAEKLAQELKIDLAECVCSLFDSERGAQVAHRCGTMRDWQKQKSVPRDDVHWMCE